MEKTTAGLLGMIAGLATLGTAEAAPHPAPLAQEALQSASYRDLLRPIPNAAELLKAHDAELAARAQTEAPVPVQFVDDHHHHHYHHHHHHAHYYPPPPPPPRYHHHHHHHHHHGVTIVVPGVGGIVAP